MSTAATSTPPPPHTAATTNVLVVDDHPVFRRGLKAVVESRPEFQVCAEAASLPEGVRAFRETRPHVVITDIKLSDGSGIELVKQLVAISKEARVLVLSMHDEALFAERALRAGAAGYVNKEEPTERILAALEHVMAGRVYLSEAMSEKIISRRFRTAGHVDSPATDSLSDRELEVFEQIGHGATTRQIAERLGLSHKTIESHREKIKAKLHLANAAELMQHAVHWVLGRSSP